MGLHIPWPAAQAVAAFLLLAGCAHLATTQSGRQALNAQLRHAAPWAMNLAGTARGPAAAPAWPARLWPGLGGAAGGSSPENLTIGEDEPAPASPGPTSVEAATVPSSGPAPGAGAVWSPGSQAAAGTGGTQRHAAAVPPEFDWKLYKFYIGSTLSSASQAQVEEHYVQSGQPNRGCYRSPPLITIRYSAEAGLTNQLLGHLSALGIAEGIASRGLPVQLLLQPALWRSSFNHSFDSASWTPAPIRTLFDVERMAAYWEPRGVTILEQDAGPEDCVPAQIDGLPTWPEPKNLAMRAVIDSLGASIGRATCTAITDNPGRSICAPLNFGLLLFTFNFSSSFPEMEVAAKGLFFAKEVVSAASAIKERVLRGISGIGFMGAHIRLENDWVAMQRPSALKLYIERMKAASFNSKSVLYVASGIFSYQNTSENVKLEEKLKSEGVCRSIMYKERVMSKEELQGFHSEQLALIDALVLSEAEEVVGICLSTLSWLILELRAMSGITRETFYMVDTQDEWCADFKRGSLSLTPGVP